MKRWNPIFFWLTCYCLYSHAGLNSSLFSEYPSMAFFLYSPPFNLFVWLPLRGLIHCVLSSHIMFCKPTWSCHTCYRFYTALHELDNSFPFGKTPSVHTKSKVVFHHFLYCSLHFFAVLLTYVSPCSSGWASWHAFVSKCLQSVWPMLKIPPMSMTWICIPESRGLSQSFGLECSSIL